MQECTKCLRSKLDEEFTKFNSSNSGRKNWCYDCRLSWRRDYNKKNKEKRNKDHRTRHLQKSLGITDNDYDLILESQNGLCEICGEFRLEKNRSHMHVDHNHETLEVRGVLCHLCNKMIGNALESTETLKSAIAYLEKHSNGKEEAGRNL